MERERERESDSGRVDRVEERAGAKRVACKSFVVIKIHLSWLDIYESPSVSPPRLRRIGF